MDGKRGWEDAWGVTGEPLNESCFVSFMFTQALGS